MLNKIKVSDYLKNFLYDTSVFLSFGLLTTVMTFPLIFKINDCIAGFFSTDEPSIWYLWWLKYAYIHKIPSAYCNLIAAPFGIDLSSFEITYPLWIQIKKLLAITFNEFFCYNFEILTGFVLSAFFVYIMMRYLTKSRTASVFSGIIFAFCPYHFARAWQHIGFSHTQWLALFLFSLLWLKEKIIKKNTILAFLSLYLIFSFDLYYAYFSLIIASVFIFYLLLKEKIKSFKLIFWVAIISLTNLAILTGRLIPLMGTLKTGISPGAWGFIRPFDDLFSQSARPLSYFLPSTEHPIFGSITQSFVGSKLYGTSFTEHTLYLGWTPLALAFVAFRRWKKMRKVGTVPFGDSPYYKENFYIGFFIFLAVVAWLFSQPPWWQFGPIKIFMPAFFIYKILPMFRAYCRFGIVVMLSVAVLAGFGLKFILEKFKTQKSKVAIACLFSGLVLFEFWNWPPYKIIDFSKVPAVYYWLKVEPGDFSIAEYPLDADSPNEMYKFYQSKHEKKIINGTIPLTHANKVAQTIRKLSRPETARVLKWMGVKHVLVHRQDYIDTGLVDDTEELNKIPQNSGLKFIRSFSSQECPKKDIMCIQKTGQIDVYEVIALPIEPVVKN